MADQEVGLAANVVQDPLGCRVGVGKHAVQVCPSALPGARAKAPLVEDQGMDAGLCELGGQVAEFDDAGVESMQQHGARLGVAGFVELPMHARALDGQLDRLHAHTASMPFNGFPVRTVFASRLLGGPVDPQRAFRHEAQEALTAALAALAPDAQLPALELPPDRAMGDLGVPCFPLARDLRKAPPAIAAELCSHVKVKGWIKEARAVGPYVNLFMDTDRLAKEILQGVPLPEAKPGKVLLEHTSANPNGPLHVGRARNPILGDTLARMQRAAGHDVDVQYYMDNLGRQVALLWWGKRNIDSASLEPAARDKADHDLVRYYQAANARMKDDPETAQTIKDLVAHLETADAQLLADVREVYEACFAGMQESLTRLGVHYDSIKDESDLVADGSVEATIEALKATDRARVEDDGANYLDMADVLEGNKSTKFFFTRKDGTSVYATRDVAYHKWKAEQVGPEGRLVDVLGEDHRLQALQVGTALEALGHHKPEVIFYSFVTLPEGKMSTRANRVVFLDDLLDQAVDLAKEAVTQREIANADAIAEAVGIAAIRFNIARIQPEKPIEFRWEEALDFDGDSAPYLMYAHARAASLEAKAKKAGIVAAFDAKLNGPGEARLAEVLSRYVTTIEESVHRAAPHRFCAYAIEVASAFNEYYRDHHVVGASDPAVAAHRLAVVGTCRDVLRRCHEALGIPVLESM